MSPKSYAEENKKKQTKIEKEVVTSLGAVTQQLMKKPTDEPVYLLRYDD